MLQPKEAQNQFLLIFYEKIYLQFSHLTKKIVRVMVAKRVESGNETGVREGRDLCIYKVELFCKKGILCSRSKKLHKIHTFN